MLKIVSLGKLLEREFLVMTNATENIPVYQRMKQYEQMKPVYLKFHIKNTNTKFQAFVTISAYNSALEDF